MPELPEVEIARRNLERWTRGRRVVRAEADDTRVFRGARRSDFEALVGRVTDIARRGKYLMLSFDGGKGLVAHLGMTGKFLHRPRGVVEPYSRARLLLDDGTVIHFRDPRLFGRFEPRAGDAQEAKAVKELGRDPLADGLTAAQLREALDDSRQDLKVALMDQSRLAGLGNIHAAEALFRAGLHPGRKPSTLTEREWAGLAEAIHAAIRFGLEEQQTEEVRYVEEPGAQNPFLVYGRAGEPCRRCRTTIESFTQAGRTTHFCPSCQPAPARGSKARPAKSSRPKTRSRS